VKVNGSLTISVECERLEALAMAGETIDLEIYGRLSDRLGRTLQRLGLKRQARPVMGLAEAHAELRRLDAVREAKP
jgi:hypothetical protein